ncbi:endonuclease I family protein [Halobacteriovorax sp.]|uniref:endonuclease I family protein n=1 Tax=Halobacteriovorax sp. TaxID=2020862 RepID=UPI0035633514
MKTILILLFCSTTYANNYYSSDDLKIILGDYQNYSLKQELQVISSKAQVENDYKDAKWHLYTNVYLEQDRKGRYFIEDIYCEKKIFNNAGPDSMVRGSKTNIEHSWPQSKFSREFGKFLQKGDLHHLFITNSKANHVRANYYFGEVDSYFNTSGRCENAGLGLLVDTPQNVASSTNEHYEPPKQYRGNIARALFYFAVRYNKKINDTQEYFLKKWHIDDPVDELDIERNDRIMNIQGNRNPFVDYPELVDRIKNF